MVIMVKARQSIWTESAITVGKYECDKRTNPVIKTTSNLLISCRRAKEKNEALIGRRIQVN